MKKAFLMLSLAVLAASAAAADDWPARPIKWIVPFPAGGQLDVVSRLIAERIGPALGQPIVIEVKTGADGNIGTDLVAKSAADGQPSFHHSRGTPRATAIATRRNALQMARLQSASEKLPRLSRPLSFIVFLAASSSVASRPVSARLVASWFIGCSSCSARRW